MKLSAHRLTQSSQFLMNSALSSTLLALNCIPFNNLMYLSYHQPQLDVSPEGKTRFLLKLYTPHSYHMSCTFAGTVNISIWIDGE